MRVLAVTATALAVWAGQASAASPTQAITPEDKRAGCLHNDLRPCMIALGSTLWFDMKLVAPQIAKRNELDVNGRTAHRKIAIDAAVPGRQIPGEWISALHDKVGNHAVEFHPVIEAGVGQLLEVLDGLGGVLLVQLRDDGAAIGLERGGFRHGWTNFSQRLPGRNPARISAAWQALARIA